MPSFGEVVIHIITTVISSIIDTTLALAADVMLLFQIISANVGIAPLPVIIVATAVLAAIIYYLFRMLKGDLKHLITAIVILAILLLLALVSSR
ncbi:MAG: hypothetical protein HYY37_01010 [Candidatus Aenigmarchaeota archaeon]|nr:hypothetical protein [Candidatus Aenigmarchaeota archaeon]